jgi:hypothetical protein
MIAGAPPARVPTADDLAGIAWWNGMTDFQRARALWAAKTAVPAEAWEYWQRSASVLFTIKRFPATKFQRASWAVLTTEAHPTPGRAMAVCPSRDAALAALEDQVRG